MSDLSVMTFNIRTDRGLDGRNSWFLRRRAVVGAIREVGPDVAGLQEVRRLQLSYLRAELPEYRFLSAGRANGRMRGEHCPVLYRHDRFTVDEWDVRWFGAEQPRRSGHAGRGRIATVAQLSDRGTGERFSIANTHFDHRSEDRRTDSAASLAGWLRTWDGPWVVMGDFNATAAEAGMAALLAGGLQDALAHVAVRGEGAATAHRFTGRRDGSRIDHILVSGLEVVESGIVHWTPNGRLPSDHWPVAARLRGCH